MKFLKTPVSLLLSLQGIIFIGIGIYFVLFRPSLLPEDLRYMNASISEIDKSLPGLFPWLQKVFTVMGAYIISTGILLLYIAQTSSFFRTKYSVLLIVISCFASIGTMTILNFILDSDFKFILLLFNLPWLICLGLIVKQKTYLNIERFS